MDIKEKISEDLKNIYSKYVYRMSSVNVKILISNDIKKYFNDNYNYEIKFDLYLDQNRIDIDLNDFLLRIRRDKIYKILRRSEHKR